MQASAVFVLAIIALANVPCVSSATGPYISSITPLMADKEGGTMITVYGAGFEDTPELKAKFTRLDPDTDQIVEKLTDCTYKSSTEMVCESPVWDEATCPYCDKEIHGSTCPQEDVSCANTYPWDNKNVVADVRYDGRVWGVGGQVHFHGEDNHHDHVGMEGYRGRYPCQTCSNEWHPTMNPNGQHPIGKRIRNGVATKFYGHTGSQFLRTDDLETDTEINRGQFIKIRSQFFSVARIERCAAGEVGCWCDGMWVETELETNQTSMTIDKYPIGPDPQSLKNSAMYNYDHDPHYWDAYSPPTCTGNWLAGTKIVLDQPIYREGGTPNMNFTTDDVYVSSKKPCVDCKCKEGCPLTMTVTTDGRTYSGGGTNGQTWHGSAAKFTAKHLVPEVFKITFPDLAGRRDSTRMFVPATGNTRIRVHGRNFQKGPMLRCYFDTPRIMVKAEFIDENTVECLTPQFVARRQDLLATRTNDNQCADHTDAENPKYFAPDIADTTSSSRLFDSTCTDSRQNGAVVFSMDGTDVDYAYSHVQVTNNGMVRDLSAVIHQRPDGANSYLEGIGSEHRSTCYQLGYPSSVVNPNYVGVDQNDAAVPPGYEQMEPCRGSHFDGQQEGNEVQIKFGTCYEGQNADTSDGSDYYGSSAVAGDAPNATHSLGQVFQIPSTSAGPLTAVDLHFEKIKATPTNAACWDPETCAEQDRRETTLEVCISAGGFAGGAERILPRDPADIQGGDGSPQIFPSADDYAFNTSGHILACEQITIQSIKSASDAYTVYFRKAPYLLGHYEYDDSTAAHWTNADQHSYYNSGDNPQTASAGNNEFDAVYFLTLSWVSGPATVEWKMADQTDSNGSPYFATDIGADRSHYGDQNGYTFDWRNNHTQPYGAANTGFRARFFTCDGCRWQYRSVVAASHDHYQIGGIYGRQNYSETYLKTYKSARCTSNEAQMGGRPYAHVTHETLGGLPRQNQAEDPTGARGDECGTPTYREQLAQAIRPTEDVTITKMRTKMRAAFASTSPTGDHSDHNHRTEVGDFQSANGATVSTWITKHGKMGEYVCQTFTGTQQVGDALLQGDLKDGTDSGWLDNFQDSMAHNAAADDELLGCGLHNKDCQHCDVNDDGVFDELCFLGARCNRTRTDVFGGCGTGGICAMAEVVSNAHYLRNAPAGSGPTTSRCGEDEDCIHSQGLKVAHSVKFEQATSDSDEREVVWEFENPVVLDKHTTYYVNMAIDETISNSDSVYWYGGTDSTTTLDGPGVGTSTDEPAHMFSRHQFLGAYLRTNVIVDDQMTFVWIKANDPGGSPDPFYFNLELMRCVTALPSIQSFSASGEGTGTCETRSSPQGGEKAPMITFTGRNFYPSKNLRVTWLTEEGKMGPTTECVSTKYDFTEMKCAAPAFDPHAGQDCTVPGHCAGVHVMATNDGINYGPELFSPKFNEPYKDCIAYKSVTGTCAAAVPSSINGSHHDYDHFVQQLGKNTLKHCFSNIHVSVSGDDFRGDGTASRPFRTLQRGIDAANENDVVVLHPGTYTGTGNRGLRHSGKKIEVVAVEADKTLINYNDRNSYRDVTIIDCEHYPDGFVLNNNKDSDSPFAGYVDFSGVTTRNCENLRIYY